MESLNEIPPERREVLLRMVVQYGEMVVREIAKLLKRSPVDLGQSVQSGLACMAAEDFEGALKHFRKGSRSTKEPEFIAGIAVLMSQCLDFLGRWDEMNEAAGVVIRSGDAIPDVGFRAMGLLLEAVAAGESGRLAIAESRLQTVKALAVKLGDQQMQALAFVDMAALELSRRNPAAAREACERAYEILRKQSGGILLSVCLNNWASADVATYEPVAAYNKLQKSLYVVRREGFLTGEADVLAQLGGLAGQLGYLDEAEEQFSRSLELSSRVASPHRIVRADRALARFALIRAEYDKAGDLYQHANEMCRRSGDRKQEGRTRGELGLVRFQDGRSKQAYNDMMAALEISRSIGDKEAAGAHLANLANVCMDLELYEEAESLLFEAGEIDRELGDELREVSCRLSLGHLRLKQGRLEEAKAIVSTTQEMLTAAKAYKVDASTVGRGIDILAEKIGEAERQIGESI